MQPVDNSAHKSLAHIVALIVLITLLTSCSEGGLGTPPIDATDTATVADTTSPELPTATATLPPTLTATPTQTPTPRPTSAPSPTPTATPKPITPASLGWQDYDPATRPDFVGEEEVTQLLLDQIEDLDIEASLGDMKYSWLKVGNEIHWRPYYISEKDNETIVYFRSPVVTPAGEIESLPSVFGCYLPFSINISQLMERGWIDSITDIRLMLNEQSGRVELGIESTGSARLWFNEEICNMLTSVDSDLEEFGLPEKPVTDTPSILIVDAATGEAFLFDYDASGQNPAGIVKPTLGPTHHLAQGQWQAVEETEFTGGTEPWTAFIGVNKDGEASLYLSSWGTNLQTLLPVYRTTPTDDAFAVAPASHTILSRSWGDEHTVAGRPKWSPDGRQIAFVGLDSDTPSISVYELETETTSHLAKVPALTNFSQGPIWSPDGSWLLYGYGGSSSASLYAVSYPEGTVNYIGQGCNPFWIRLLRTSWR